MLRLASALMLLALAASLRAQAAPVAQPEAQAAVEPGQQPDAARDTVLQAEQALDLAARFQRGDTPRAAPTSLHGTFQVSLQDEKGNRVSADVERWYRRSPEAILTTRKEAVSQLSTTQCFAGGVAWFRDNGKGKVIVYSDDPAVHDVDLEDMREQLRLTRLLLDTCVIDALRARLTEPRLAGRDRVKDPDGAVHEVLLVDATAPDELFGPAPGAPPPPPGSAQPRIELQFGVGVEDGALWSLRVRAPHRPDLQPMRMVFALHGLTAGGLRVPGLIKVYRGDEPREALKLGLAEDAEGRLLFDVDVPVDGALFARPAPDSN
jgi:hypothetical protein